MKNDRVLESNELIFDPKKLIALGRLYHTLKWFVREIWDLRSSNAPSSTIQNTSNNLLEHADDNEPESSEAKNSKRWSSQEPRPPKENNGDLTPVLLPLRGEIAK